MRELWGSVLGVVLVVVGCGDSSAGPGDAMADVVPPMDAALDVATDTSSDASNVDAPLIEVMPTSAWPDGSSCGAVALPTTAICGGMDGCELMVDEALPGEPQRSLRADQLALADGEPHVLYSHNIGTFHGWHAQRTATGWTAAELEVPLARGRLLTAPGQPVQLLAYDGAFGVSRWNLTDGWTPVDRFIGLLQGEAALDDAGCVHLLADIDDGSGWAGAVYGRVDSDDNWHFTQISDESGQSRLAVVSDGTPHVFYSEASDGVWQARHAHPGGDEEANLPASSILAVSESETDLLLHTLTHSPLTYARHAGDSIESAPLGLENSGEDCLSMPSTEGETCTLDATTYGGLAIAASGDTPAAVLVARIHDTGELASTCGEPIGGMPPMCNWDNTGVSREGQLLLVWVDADGPHERVILDAVIGSAAAIVGTGGTLHVLVAEAPNGIDRAALEYTMRYLRLDAPGS